MQKLADILGLCVVLIGMLHPIFKRSVLGDLPGYIFLIGEDGSFYLPIVTEVIISIIMSVSYPLFE